MSDPSQGSDGLNGSDPALTRIVALSQNPRSYTDGRSACAHFSLRPTASMKSSTAERPCALLGEQGGGCKE